MGQSSFFLTGFDYVTNGQARVVEELQNPEIMNITRNSGMRESCRKFWNIHDGDISMA